jgi:hypothetical protein
VLDEHEAHVGRQRGEQRDQLPSLGRRQAGRRLVEQDEPRRPGQGHADLELALLAVGERGDGLGGDGGEPHALEEVAGGRPRGVVGPRAEQREAPAGDAAHSQEHVVLHRQLAEQQRGLIGAAQALADPVVRRPGGDVLAEEAHPPGGGGEVAGDHVEQGGLAGAVGADDGPALAGGDGERHTVHCPQRAEGAGDVLEHEGVTRRQCAHGQLGTSREPRPTLSNSALDMPSR